jgi:hypothetical protein
MSIEKTGVPIHKNSMLQIDGLTIMNHNQNTVYIGKSNQTNNHTIVADHTGGVLNVSSNSSWVLGSSSINYNTPKEVDINTLSDFELNAVYTTLTAFAALGQHIRLHGEDLLPKVKEEISKREIEKILQNNQRRR